MIFRPQSKRNKQHRELMSSLAKGEEVLTSGGLLGKITKVSAESDYIVIALNDTNEVTIKRFYRSRSTERFYQITLIYLPDKVRTRVFSA